MKGSIAVLVMAGCAALSACSQAPSAIGTFMGGDETGQMMVQISSVKDKEIRGSFTFVANSDAGRVTAGTRNLSGTIDSRLLNMTLENGTGLSLLSGTLTNDDLALTIIGPEKSDTIMLERRDATEFAGLVQGVRRHAAERKLATEQGAVQAARLKRLSGDQDRISAFALEVRGKTDNIAKGVAEIERIAAAYQRVVKQAGRLGAEHSTLVAQVGAGDFRVGQVAFERQRNSNDAITHHEWVRDAVKSLVENTATRERQAASILAQCRTTPELDCGDVVSAMMEYRTRATAFRGAAMRENAAFANAQPKL